MLFLISVAEGRVANFLLATTGIFNLRSSATEEKLTINVSCELLLAHSWFFSLVVAQIC